MPKVFFRLSLLIILTCSGFATSLAQIEIYADAALHWPANEISEQSEQEFMATTGWSLTAKALVGRRQLSPFVGIQAQSMSYEQPANAENLRLFHLGIPIGLAYHLRERSSSFNLMSTLAWSPMLLFDEPIVGITADRSLPSHFQLGITLTLDYLYIGSRWQFFPDGRFGTQNAWTTANGLFIGVRW